MQIKKDKGQLQLDLHSQIREYLSSEYLIKFPQIVHSLQQIINQAVVGMQQSIFKLKYGLNQQYIMRYSIKNIKFSSNPFPEQQLQLIDKIVNICTLILVNKDYDIISKSLTQLNSILHSQCHHQSIRQQHPEKIEEILNQPGHKLQLRKQQKLHQAEIILYQQEQANKKYPNQKMKIHLTKEFQQFNLNFRHINFKEAIVFESLRRCQIWFTICRQRRKSAKGFYLDPLINTFDSIVKKLQITSNPFHISILPKKNIQKIQQKKRVEKAKNSLFDAVTYRRHNQVKKLILNGADIQALALGNERIARELRCVHQAASNNDLEMCKILTSFGVNWQSQDSQKMSPIFYTIQGRSMQVLKYLVEEVKVNIEKMQIQNRTPFYWACTEGQIQYIKYLYEKGANINHRSKLGRCPLSKACFLGRRDIVEFLINCKQIDINSQDQKGRTPLHNATFGSKGGRQGQKFGTNASDSPECAQLLLQKGFYVDFLDFQQNTSLHIATSSQALDSIRLLVAWGADMSKVNNYGQTPIMTGAKFGHLESVQLLYQQFHSPITHKDIFGKNLLLLVAKFRSFKENAEKHFPTHGTIEQKTVFKKLNTQINPVFNYIVEKYIYELYGKWNDHKELSEVEFTEEQRLKNVEQLHYTFKEMLYNAVHEQFIFFTKKLILHHVPFPKITLKDAKYLLEMENLLKGQQQKKLILQILLSKNQEGFHVFQLEKQSIIEFIAWLINKNEIKLLQFASDNQILIFYHFNKKKHLEIQDYFCDLPMNILIESLPFLKQKVLTFCLLNLTFDWLSYIDENTGGNILHLLIRHRKVGTLIQITKLLSGKKMEFARNKYLIEIMNKQALAQVELKQQYSFINSPINKQFLRLLSHKDNDSITPFQLAHIVKEPSIIKILSQRLTQTSLFHEHPENLFEKFEVKQYKIEKEESDQIELKKFEAGYELEKQLQELIEKLNKCQTKQEISGLIPILKPAQQLSNYVNIDDDALKQWHNMKSRKLYYIKTEEDINILIPVLSSKVVGIDTQYDYAENSETIICVFQISTLQADYIIDMMSCSFQSGQNRYRQFVKKLKNEFWQPLVYNQNIVKLMHGSDHDLYILKSCFNCSFINFFDTSRIDIDYRKQSGIRGLATLTKQYLNVYMSKDHQISEWRIRPIPQTMLDYARRDSMILPFLVRNMLKKFQKVQDLKDTILNSWRHMKKNKKLNQPLIKNLIVI